MLPPKPVVDLTHLPSAKVEEAGVVVDPSLTFTHRALQLACEYWHTRRGAREMPAREDLHTAEMREFIAHLVLVGIAEPERLDADFTIRLAGKEVEKVFGPISGRQLSEAVPEDAGARWRTAYNCVRSTRQPIRISGHVRFQDKRWLTGETLMAPLGDTTVRMIYCAFAAWHYMEKACGA